MNFIYVLNGKKIKNTLLIVLISFFTAVLLFTQNIVHIPVFSVKDGPKAIYKGENGIALTFDLGWGDERAEPIIETLIKNNINRATFFLSGSWAERHPDLVKKIVENKFEIGILGYSYTDYTSLENSEIRKDIQKAQAVFKKLQVKDIKLLRAPTGHFDKRVIQIANQYGLTIVHWSVNTNDWKNPGVNKIIENGSKARNGDIILLHASDSAKQTKKALPDLIQRIKDKGDFVTVSDMMTNGKVHTTLVP
ncbi:polysaccharide deacetylase family sporulation protein PdaB [Oikeobacillus pervagus]|uniref:Polysaccharide deacetylase family sporulation protein PdaB n=1 Tax=Oikeobacillus pervagus TaxID=1325931 RepID=A0AAJ1WK58_9BACI|nr:polysaccharide deacetylase family sporulation protein PdaB [Oikeobacillus pervagus]MDQ0216168.1 polysaccharide deacetylase family sporulation protein PdaB [Oikeobacillus pervagus]